MADQTLQQATPAPPIKTYTPPVDPYGPGPKYMPKKVTIIVLIIILGIFIFGLYNNFQDTRANPQTQMPEHEPSAVPTSDPTVDWKTYADNKNGFSLKYPPGYTYSPYFADETRPHIQSLAQGITFISDDQSLTVLVGSVSAYYRTFPFAKIVQTGSLIDSCFEDDPQQSDEFINDKGIKGMQILYWKQKGCRGTAQRTLSSQYTFFDNRANSNTIIQITSTGMDKTANQMLATFTLDTPEPAKVINQVLWEVPEGILPQAVEKEIKNVFDSYDPRLENGEYLVVAYAETSPTSEDYVFTSMAIKDKDKQIKATDGFEYMLHKEGSLWKIYKSEDNAFCAVLKKAPEDLLEGRRDYYIECFPK